MLQQWRTVGKTVSDLTGRELNLRPSAPEKIIFKACELQRPFCRILEIGCKQGAAKAEKIKTYVFTTNLIAWLGFNPYPDHVLVFWNKMLEENLCYLGQETAKGPFGLQVNLPPVYHTWWRVHTVYFYSGTSSREAVNTNFCSLWFNQTGNRTQIDRQPKNAVYEYAILCIRLAKYFTYITILKKFPYIVEKSCSSYVVFIWSSKSLSNFSAIPKFT